MSRRKQAAEEAERQRLQAEAEAKAAAEAAEHARIQAERDATDAPGSPKGHETGMYRNQQRHSLLNCTLIVNDVHHSNHLVFKKFKIQCPLIWLNQQLNSF